MRERRTQFELIRSGLATGILVAALLFQMLPFFLLMVVMAYAMGVTGNLDGIAVNSTGLAGNVGKRNRHGQDQD